MNKLAQVDIGNFFNSPLGQTRGVGSLISLILTAAISLAGIVVLFYFVMGGFKIITSAGKNDPKSHAEGKEAITWAIIGFVIIFAVYWIIRFIEIISGVPFITNPTFDGPLIIGGPN